MFVNRDAVASFIGCPPLRLLSRNTGVSDPQNTERSYRVSERIVYLAAKATSSARTQSCYISMFVAALDPCASVSEYISSRKAKKVHNRLPSPWRRRRIFLPEAGDRNELKTDEVRPDEDRYGRSTALPRMDYI
jgi:hypothetical protein